MRRMVNTGVALGLALALTACGTASNTPFANTVRQLTQQVVASKPLTLAQQRANVVQTVRNANLPDPVLMIELPDRDAVASMIVGGVSKGAVSWFDATGVSVTERSGVVLQTRGLGDDLMASDVSGTLEAIRSGRRNYARTHRYVNGEGVLARVDFSCSATQAGGVLSETCTSPGMGFTNSYTVRNGTVRKSRQWISPMVGYVDLTRLQ